MTERLQVHPFNLKLNWGNLWHTILSVGRELWWSLTVYANKLYGLFGFFWWRNGSNRLIRSKFLIPFHHRMLFLVFGIRLSLSWALDQITNTSSLFHKWVVNSTSDVKCALCCTKTLYLLHHLFYELRLQLSSFMICTDSNINLYFQKDVSFVFISQHPQAYRVAYAWVNSKRIHLTYATL